MFKNITYRNRIILFISSYLPLYLVIIIEEISLLFDNIKRLLTLQSIGIIDVILNKEKTLEYVIFIFRSIEFYVAAIFFSILIASIVLLGLMLKRLMKYKDEAFMIKVVKIKNVNYEYVLTYFSAYMLPFITFSLNTITGILQFAILWGLIGYMYVKNNLIYINPTLNIIFKYNIYETVMEYSDEEEILIISAVLLSTKEKYEINKISVVKESEELYIECN